MLFAVVIGDSPGERGDSSWSGTERREFLDALKRAGNLVLEATYGEGGSLMFLYADSTNDALAMLHNDPHVLASSRIRIRPLAVNYLAEDLLPRASRADEPRRTRKRPDMRLVDRRKEGGSA